MTLRKEWVNRCYCDKFDPRNKRICNKHFLQNDFEDELQAKLLNIPPKKLKKTAVPSINLLPVEPSTTLTERSKWKELKVRKEIVEELLSTSVDPTALDSTMEFSAYTRSSKEVSCLSSEPLPSTSKEGSQEEVEGYIATLKKENWELKNRMWN